MIYLGRKRFNGFTIAEMLIVMSIIGIIASIILPNTYFKLKERVFEQSKSLAVQKIKQSTDVMKTNDILSGYSTNDAFFNEFQKNFKIALRCGVSNLSTCFPTAFWTNSGELILLSALKVGKDLGQEENPSNLVGAVLINGVSVLLAFDPNCARIDPNDNTSDTTSCLALVYDVNGHRGPNVIGKDIALLNATITTCDGIKQGSLCVATNDLVSINWANADSQCSSIGMRLPTLSELATLRANKATIGGFGNYSWYWSSQLDGASNAWGTNFNDGANSSRPRYNYQNARCVK